MTGQIHIGAPDGAANYLLPQVCAKIGADNPGLEIQILALQRVVNLSKREADMVVTVSPPQAGRLNVQKITDYHLHLVARAQVADIIASRIDLAAHRLVGYIPDMILDGELDHLGDLASGGVPLASNSVAVQVMALRAAAGVGVVHNFAPVLKRVLMDEIALTRSFYLVRHDSDRRFGSARPVADLLTAGLRAEVARLEVDVA